MRRVVHVARLLGTVITFGRGGGRLTVMAVVILGLVLLALTLTAQAVVPIAAYPFA